MWIPSWSWKSGPALTLAVLLGGGHGSRPSSLHVLCGLEEGLPPPENPVGGTAGVWGTGAIDAYHSVLVQKEQSMLSVVVGSAKIVHCHRFCL